MTFGLENGPMFNPGGGMGGAYGVTGSPATGWSFIKTAAVGAETVAQLGVSDVAIASGGVDVVNLSAVDAEFRALLRLTSTTTSANVLRFSSATNSGSNALGIIDSLIGTATVPVGRPCLVFSRVSSTYHAYNFSGKSSLTPLAATSGAVSAFAITPPADTTQTLSTEIPGFVFNTFTRSWATGAITTQREFLVKAPTYAFTGASTISDAATLVIDAAPIAGSNATITRAMALWVQSGLARFDGGASFGLRADLKSYTVGTLPAAGAAGGVIFVEDAGGNGPCIAVSNGTNWKRCDNVSTTVVV